MVFGDLIKMVLRVMALCSEEVNVGGFSKHANT